MKNTTEALITLLEVGNKVKTAIADDGKVNLSESIGIAMKAVQIVGIFKNLPEIKKELKAATSMDILALVETFKTNFDLNNEEAEQTVEQGIEVLTQLALMVFKK